MLSVDIYLYSNYLKLNERFGTGSAHFKVNFRSALMYICVLRINVFVTIYGHWK